MKKETPEIKIKEKNWYKKLQNAQVTDFSEKLYPL